MNTACYEECQRTDENGIHRCHLHICRVCPSVSECVQLSVLTVQLHVTRQLLLLHRRE